MKHASCPRIEVRNGKIVIIRNKPRHESIPQTQRDREHCNKRRQAQGRAFDKMTQTLTVAMGGNLSRVGLLELARTIAVQKGIALDRTATRMKDALICWFCENAGELPSTVLVEQVQPRRELYDLFPEEEVHWISDLDN
jgi:hypothetical protein